MTMTLDWLVERFRTASKEGPMVVLPEEAKVIEDFLSQPQPVAQGEAVGVLSIDNFRDCRSMQNVQFDYTGDLPVGTHNLYTSPTIPTGHRIVPEVPQDLSTSTDGFGINRPVNAMLADALRHLAKPGQKVIWRGSFRWFDDDGVLSNHYDGMDIDQLASEFDYDVHYNAHHAALVSKLNAAPTGGG